MAGPTVISVMMNHDEESSQRCNRTDLGVWLKETGGEFHPSLVSKVTNTKDSSTRKSFHSPSHLEVFLHGVHGHCLRTENSMGNGVYADGPIGKNDILASCSIQAAITPQSSLELIEKLLENCSDGKFNSSLDGQSTIESYRVVTMSWVDRQVMSLYLILTKLSIMITTKSTPADSKWIKHSLCSSQLTQESALFFFADSRLMGSFFRFSW